MRKNNAFKNADEPLRTPTYDGSGQCVHPDVLRVDGRFHDVKYLMVMEPFPFGDSSYENPSLLCSDDGIAWMVPDTLRNPVVEEPAPQGSWNSDGDMVVHDNEELLLYFRQNSGDGETSLLSKRSPDGVHWTGAARVLTVKDSRVFASPAFVQCDEELGMFYVNTSRCSVNLMKSGDGMKWEGERTLFFFLNAWHLDALMLEGMTYILLNDRRSLFLLRSEDLRTWHIFAPTEKKGSQRQWLEMSPSESYRPLVAPSQNGWDNRLIYRSAFAIRDDMLSIWYSAQSTGNEWRIGYTDGILER